MLSNCSNVEQGVARDSTTLFFIGLLQRKVVFSRLVSFSRAAGFLQPACQANNYQSMEVGAEDASRFSAESEVAMHSMQRLLELARRMESAVASSALLSNVELANIEELTLKLEVYKVFLGISHIRPNDLPDEKHCRLGQWYYDGEGRERFSGLPGYAELETPHRAVHTHARQSVVLYYEGKLEAALVELQAMESANLTVMGGMSRMLGKAVER